MPSPETTTNSDDQPVRAARRAASAIPIPPIATPAGSSQIAPRRSDQSPNSGWTIEAESVDARISTAASVYERSNSSYEEREQRGQRAAGEVDRAVAAREQPPSPAGRSARARGSLSRGGSDSIAPPMEIAVSAGSGRGRRHRLRRPRPARHARPTSTRGCRARRVGRGAPAQPGARASSTGTTAGTSSPPAPAGATARRRLAPRRRRRRRPARRSAGRVAWQLDDSLPLARGRAGARGRRRARPRRLRPGPLEDRRPRGKQVERLVLVGADERDADAAQRAERDRALGEPRARPREPPAERPHAGARSPSARPRSRQGSDRSRTRRSTPTRSTRSAWARSPPSRRGATTSRG